MMLTNGGRKVGRANRGIASGEVHWFSDWAYLAGSTDPAIQDNNKWTNVYCPTRADVVTVLTGAEVTALGWTRTPNIIRFMQRSSGVPLVGWCGGIESQNVVPVSTSHYGRTFFRSDQTNGINQHALTYNLLGAIQVTIWGQEGSAGGVRKFIRTYYDSAGDQSAWPNDAWYPTAVLLAHATWYRYEWWMEYVTATTYRIHPRIYNMAGVLLYDSATYFHNNTPPAGGATLAAWYAAGNTYGITDVQLARHLGLTMEGQPGAANNDLSWYHADMKLSLDDWIGDN